MLGNFVLSPGYSSERCSQESIMVSCHKFCNWVGNVIPMVGHYLAVTNFHGNYHGYIDFCSLFLREVVGSLAFLCFGYPSVVILGPFLVDSSLFTALYSACGDLSHPISSAIIGQDQHSVFFSLAASKRV